MEQSTFCRDLCSELRTLFGVLWAEEVEEELEEQDSLHVVAATGSGGHLSLSETLFADASNVATS